MKKAKPYPRRTQRLFGSSKMQAVRHSRAYLGSVESGVNATADHLHRLGYKVAISLTPELDAFMQRFERRLQSVRVGHPVLSNNCDHHADGIGEALPVGSLKVDTHAGTPVVENAHRSAWSCPVCAEELAAVRLQQMNAVVGGAKP